MEKVRDYAYEIPVSTCPRCGAEYDDYRGAGVRYCPKCGYCTHDAVTADGICFACGKKVK